MPLNIFITCSLFLNSASFAWSSFSFFLRSYIEWKQVKRDIKSIMQLKPIDIHIETHEFLPNGNWHIIKVYQR